MRSSGPNLLFVCANRLVWMKAQAAFMALGILPLDETAGFYTQGSLDPLQMVGISPQLPFEDSTPSFLPYLSTERQGRLAILSKTMVYLVDMAWYRELYDDSGKASLGTSIY